MKPESHSIPLPGRSPGRRSARLELGALVGFGLTLLVLLIGIYYVDWNQILVTFRGVSILPVIGTSFIFSLSFPVFAARWQWLLAVESPPSVGRLFRFLMIGCLANATFPGRPGDLVRLALVRRTGVRLTVSGASLLIERMLDVAFITALGLVLSLVIDLPPAVSYGLRFVFVCMVVAVVVASLMAGRSAWIRTLPSRYPARLSGGIGAIVVDRAATFSAAMGLMRSPGQLAVAAGLTAAGWLPQVLGVEILLRAFHLPVPPAAGLLVIVTTNLGAAIPSSPSNFGLYHGLAVLSLAVFGVEPEQALAFAICTHTIAIGLHVGFGIASSLAEGVSLVRLGELRDSLTPDRPAEEITACGEAIRVAASKAPC